LLEEAGDLADAAVVGQPGEVDADDDRRAVRELPGRPACLALPSWVATW